VVVEAPRVTLTEGAQIGSGSFGPGQGGTVQVTAADTLTLTGRSSNGLFASSIFADARGTGAGAGNAGSVVVEAPRVTLTEGAQISSSTFGPGQGGTVQVTAADTLTLSGTSPDGRFPSGIRATAQGTGTGAGDAGAVVVAAHTGRIADGAQISSSTLGPGQGGTMTVTTTDALTITGRDSGLRTTAASSGRGGDIAVDALQVQLTDGAAISADSAGTGNAGNITITLRDMFLSQHGTVATQASQAYGGNIQLTAPRMIRLRDSQVTAAVGGGPTTVGGNITIDPQFVVLQNSQIVANAFEGRGGNIRLQAQQAFLADQASLVSASSTLGINGQVAIQAPVTSISGAVAPLPQAFAQAAEILRDRCVERLRGGTVSRLVLGGRDGVPLEPGSLLLSPPVQGEQPGPVPLTDTVAELELHNIGSLSLRGMHAPTRWPGVLDVECAKWMGH
jgi:large exoprotein involved in heme utilization and adhesion